MRNRFARALGYPHFYEYKSRMEEGMASETVFEIFDTLTARLTEKFAEIDALAADSPDLRKPWNLDYALAGDFTAREDPYFPLATILERWGRSFQNMGIGYRGATLTLDLLERSGKYNNGFCHMPTPVNYQDGVRTPCQTNFTCNAIIGQVGSGHRTGTTLFHEGGHAAHFANMDQPDIIINTEYPPMSTAWAETQSMFLDTVFSSPEWRVRYARTLSGETFPLSLYAQSLSRLHITAGNTMLRVASVVEFERRMYTVDEDTLTPDYVCETAHAISRKYYHYSEPSLLILTVPHIYSWHAACAYHGYGLATLALHQWQDRIYREHGALVDNPHVGAILTRAGTMGASRTFAEMVEEVTGAALSPDAYLASVLSTVEERLAEDTRRIALMDERYPHDESTEIDLDASIRIVDGSTTISTNEGGFTGMSEGWAEYVRRRG